MSIYIPSDDESVTLEYLNNFFVLKRNASQTINTLVDIAGATLTGAVNFIDTVNLNGATASRYLMTDANKNIIAVTTPYNAVLSADNTFTGNNTFFTLNGSSGTFNQTSFVNPLSVTLLQNNDTIQSNTIDIYNKYFFTLSNKTISTITQDIDFGQHWLKSFLYLPLGNILFWSVILNKAVSNDYASGIIEFTTISTTNTGISSVSIQSFYVYSLNGTPVISALTSAYGVNPSYIVYSPSTSSNTSTASFTFSVINNLSGAIMSGTSFCRFYAGRGFYQTNSWQVV